MNTSLVLTLDTRKDRKRKDGSYPIILRLSHGRNSRVINLGYAVVPGDWDEKNRKVKESSKVTTSIKRLNNLLTKKKSEAMGIIVKLEEKGELTSLSIKDLTSLIKFGKNPIVAETQNERLSFFVFTKELINNMRRANRFGNAQVYEDTMKAMKRYMGDEKDLHFPQITYDFLVAYETDYLSRGNAVNGLAVKLRTIRAIYNKAIKSKVIERNLYPFVDYQIKNEKTRKRAISKEDLLKVLRLELDPDHELFHARNFFLIAYNSYGMNFIDMAFLQVKHIRNGRVTYRRKKTSRFYDVHITNALATLISPYLFGKESEDFIFPILTQQALERQYRQVKDKRKMYNTALKGIASLVGIEENLSSYVVRHSFATQAVWNDVPLKALQQMLGHESIKTTEVYVADLPKKVIDNYSEQLALG